MSTKVDNLDDLIDLAHHYEIVWVNSPEEQHKSLGYLIELAENLLLDLQPTLNRVHNCEYSVRYWHIVIGPWLIQFLSVFYDRYTLVNQVIEHEPNISFGATKDSFITPRNTYEALKLAETNQFNQQIIRDLILSFGGFDIEELESKRDLKFETNPVFSDNNGFKKKLLNKFSKFMTSKSSIVASLSAFPITFQKRLISKVPNLRPIYPFIDGVENYNQEVNNSLRSKIFTGISVKNNFEKILCAHLPYYIPVCFLEGFDKLNELSYRYGRSPKIIITGTEMYTRYESYMHWVGRSSEKGTKIISMQHGGNYGIEYHCEKNFIEINPYDIFYSWGWDWSQYGRYDHSTIRKMPSVFLQSNNHQEISRNTPHKILFLTTSKRQYARRFDGAVNNVYTNKQYFNSQILFYDALDERCKHICQVRLYKDDLKNNYKERWKEAFSEIKFDSEPAFIESLSESKILIVDHISTTWLEALSFNIPFLIYVQGDRYDFTNEFAEIIRLLKNVSIFHESAEEAATRVNTIQENIGTWWFSTEVQDTLNNIRLLMAYSPLNADDLWIKELKSL